MRYSIIIALICAFVVISCGKKEEPKTELQQQITQPPQNQTQQQTQTNPTDTAKVKKEELKKEADKKKEEEKKKEEDKKKEELKKTDDLQTSNIDFASIFAKRCVKCHGKDAKGKKDGGPDLTTSKVKSKSDKNLYNIISNGVKADNEDDNDMPAFKNKLTEDEIHAAVKYVKGL
jgi:cytochrome c5